MEKKKVMILSMLILIVSASGLAMLFFSFGKDPSVPINMEVEESVDVSFSQWDTTTRRYYTAIAEVDDYVTIVDTSVGNSADMTLSFNKIDIGYLKMKLRMPSEKYYEYFAIEFMSNGDVLFKLEKIHESFALIVGTLQMKLLDWDTNWHAIEIFFDLSNSNEGKISVKVDGNKVIDDLTFIPANDNEIDTLHMYTGIVPRSIVDVNFETLNNLKIV